MECIMLEIIVVLMILHKFAAMRCVCTQSFSKSLTQRNFNVNHESIYLTHINGKIQTHCFGSLQNSTLELRQVLHNQQVHVSLLTFEANVKHLT